MKTIIVGFDAFDPTFFERLHSEGKLPNLSKFVQSGGYSPFTVSNPPQSEVSWTSIATGLDPGGHGIFDFVHRNPNTYVPYVSLLTTKSSAVGTQFIPPHQAQTIFDEAVQDGYPATSLWWPATFPARFESPIRSIPGLGAPDIMGRLGVGIAFSPEFGSQEKKKTQLEKLEKKQGSIYQGWLTGPTGKTLTGIKETGLDITLEISDDKSGKLIIGKQSWRLEAGKWSPILEINFKMGIGVSVKAVTRVILSKLEPEPVLYFLPLQIHPLHNPWRYATPKGFVKDLWKNQGPFLTLGWPQDTTGLEEGWITDQQFIDLCSRITLEREHVFMHLLDKFSEGVLGCVFDSLDRLQHMFWHDRPDIIEDYYVKLDDLFGRIETRVQQSKNHDSHLIMVSDHGSKDFNYKVNLNKWLVNQGLITANVTEDKGSIKEADWAKTQAYAIGLNSLYINQSGREGEGTVTADQKPEVIESIRQGLLKWKGPDGLNVVKNVYLHDEVYEGPLAEYGPDLLIGYTAGYRASAETGLGEWNKEEIETNSDHWGADHCMDPAEVPGVLFSNRGLKDIPNPPHNYSSG